MKPDQPEQDLTTMTHQDCTRCVSLAKEAAECAAKYDAPSWTSVDGNHGAVFERGWRARDAG